MALSERIRGIRKHRKLTQTEMATELGITQTSLSQLEAGKNGISYEVFKALCERFDVDPTWLMDGVGEMYRSANATKKTGSVMPLVVTVESDGDENIVLVNAKAAAGYLQHQQDPEYMASLPSFRLPGYYGKTYRAFEVQGSSMLPAIVPGDILIGSYEDALSHIRNGSLYIIVLHDGSIVVKRVRASGFNRFELSSDNKEYQPYEVSAEEIAQVWQVEGRITREFARPDTNIQNGLTSLEQRLIDLERKMNSTGNNN